MAAKKQIIERDHAHMPGETEITSFMHEAIVEAQNGMEEGGIPIGSVLVRKGKIIGRGHNRRIQFGDPTAHAEIDCLRAAGRQKTYKNTILISTLMPCAMCAGAAIQFGVPIVIAGENRSFSSSKKLMENAGIKILDLNLDECFDMLAQFAKERPSLWNEDIGLEQEDL
ncbi:MAG: nucleoside deaminase [Candidatus Obscuribacterales bacterium]|nr:nucleoside deaminase [Candidatus Obscuribacterales bacterium]